MAQRIQETQVLATGISFEAFLEQFAGQRAEWINGMVVAMSPVDRKHDDISRFLILLLELYLRYRPVAILRAAPTTMRLGDDLPAREPDLQLIRNEHADRVTDTYVDGPADWAIEIVSPESLMRDRGDKFYEYERGGVNEYWIIDPHRQELLAYRRGEDGLYQAIPLDEDGSIASVTLPDFRFEVALLWRSPSLDAADCLKIVQQMLGG